jgi:ABC-2 type transport system permease protein
MRTFAEERRSGTLAALLTTPASATAVVWAKFLSTWIVWVVFWLLFTLFPFLTVQRLGTPGDTRLGDPSILWGGLCFIAISGLLHVAIGILCSCVTRSSALAALLAFISLLAMTAAGGAMESLPIESWEWLGWLREPAAHLRTFGHLQDFAAGILDSRPIILYGTGTLLCLGLAVLSVEGQE